MELINVITSLGDHTRDVILITEAQPIDMPGPRILWASRAFTEMTGYDLDEVIGQTPRILQGKDTAEKARSDIRQALQTWNPVHVILKNYTKQGVGFWVELDIKPVSDESGWVWYWVAVQRDVTAEYENKLKLEQAIADVKRLEQTVRLATDAGEIGIWEFEFSTGLVKWDSVMYRLYDVDSSSDCSPREIWKDCVGPRDVQRMDAILIESAKSGADFDVEYSIRTASGHERILRSRATFEFDVDGNAIRSIGVEYDVTNRVMRERALIAIQAELVSANKKIQYDAVHDALTGIGNRRGVNEHIATLTETCPPATCVSVLLLDLDHFKSINDIFSHAGGDFLLREVAKILSDIAIEGAYVARLGGDEFILILSGAHSKKRAMNLASQIFEAFRKPLLHEKKEIHFGTSIGVATGVVEVAKDLFHNADIALYEAKKKGRNQMQLFTPELRARAELQKRRSDAFLAALETDRIGVRLQPQICAKTNNIVGVEALARWWTEDNCELLPGEFLPVAEYLGILHELDRHILSKAVDSARKLKNRDVNLPRISVNVSPRRLMDPQLLDEIDALENLPCPIAFELLESINFDNVSEEIIKRVDALRARNIIIELDDFGSGHASITTLLRLQPDRIKIDKRLLIDGRTSDGKATLLLQAICTMCKGLNIPITAEGVETQEISDLATKMGFDALQGFFIAKPLTIDEFLNWLEVRNQT